MQASMPTWSKVNLAEWQAGPGEKPHAIKQRFTYDDLATADDDMRAKAVDPLRPPRFTGFGLMGDVT